MINSSLKKGFAANNLYEFTMKVRPGGVVELPGAAKGAYVACYAAASDYQAALRKGVKEIMQLGYTFEDIKGSVREIPPDSWADYVKNVWPECENQLPTSKQLPSLIKDGQVFFGPFIGFSS